MKTYLILTVLLGLVTFTTGSVHAAAPTPEPSTEGVTIESVFPWAQSFPTFGALISTLLPNVLLFAGIVLMMYAIVGGLMLMKSAGSGNADEASKGKNALTYGVIGFVIVFSAYFIIQLVEYMTGVPIFNSGL